MDFEQVLERCKPFLKQHWLPLSIGFLGLIFLVYGLIVLIGASSSSSDIVFESANQTSENISSSTTEKEIAVDIEGAVARPGVYHLPADSRIQDALIACGGLSVSANRTWVSRNINLALKLRDGTKIYIPRIEEEGAVSSSTSTTGITSKESSQININTATDGELDTLAGIGPVTAQKIINNRPYNSIEELLTKKVVGEKVFEGIKEKITTY